MNFNGWETFQLCLCVFALGLVCGIGFCFHSWELAGTVRQEAVKNGVAHYISDENGRPQFEWKKGE